MIWQDVGLLFDTSIWMKHTSSGDIKVLSLKAMIRELLELCPRESVTLNYPGIHTLTKEYASTSITTGSRSVGKGLCNNTILIIDTVIFYSIQQAFIETFFDLMRSLTFFLHILTTICLR